MTHITLRIPIPYARAYYAINRRMRRLTYQKPPTFSALNELIKRKIAQRGGNTRGLYQ